MRPPVHVAVGAGLGHRHLPFSKWVPVGQQLGKVPTGRSPWQMGLVSCWLVPLVPPTLLPLVVPPLPLVPGPDPPVRRQAPCAKRVPTGQQSGNVPTGRSRG